VTGEERSNEEAALRHFRAALAAPAAAPEREAWADRQAEIHERRGALIDDALGAAATPEPTCKHGFRSAHDWTNTTRDAAYDFRCPGPGVAATPDKPDEEKP
jgi:hypothetical protein